MSPTFADPRGPRATIRKELAIFDFELTEPACTTRSCAEPRTGAPCAGRRAAADTELAESGRFSLVDIAPIMRGAQQPAILRRLRHQACEELGADLAVTGMVFKFSNLILNMTIYCARHQDRQQPRGGTAPTCAATPTNPGRARRLAGAQPAAGACLRRAEAAIGAHGSGLQARGVPAQMIVHEGGDEVIAVVVTGLATQGEGNVRPLARSLQ